MAKIILSAQNFDIYTGDRKDLYARTGDVSIEMLGRAGAKGVMFGHSEVGDTAQITRQKMLTLLHKRITNPHLLTYSTLLIGESWAQFTGHSVDEVAEIVGRQLVTILKDIPKDFLKDLVIGYEPKWGSRGSGHDSEPPPSSELISTCVKSIKHKLAETFGELANQTPIIYGGRSTPERTEQILADKNIQGLILGSACNTVQKTLEIAYAMQKTMGARKKILHANFKAYDLSDSYKKYVSELRTLDDSYIVYLSPCYTDICAVKAVL